MKKLIALFMGAAMVFSLAACSGGNPSSPDTTNPSETSESSASSTAPDTSEPGSTETTAGTEGGSTLVVYFSATGNTEKAATYIAEITGGDLFELEPAQPYTDEDLNYGNDDSRVSREHEDESLRDVELVADTVDNWDSYDTVFIGYPIWWGIAAWPCTASLTNTISPAKPLSPSMSTTAAGFPGPSRPSRSWSQTPQWLRTASR